mgnify:CR=1 FL=1
MFGTIYITNTEISGTTDVYCLVNYWYSILFPLCRVRTQNVLEAYCKTFTTQNDFYHAILDITPTKALKLPNCGRRTVEEIMNLSQKLKQKAEELNGIKFCNPMDISTENVPYTEEAESLTQTIPSVTLPENMNKLLPLIHDKIDCLTIRARNAVRLFFTKHNSVQHIYETISVPNFSAYQLKNVGRRTIQEVQQFMDELKEFIEQFKDSAAVESFINEYSAPKLSDISIPKEYQENIWALKDKLGYFPLFTAISAYFAGLDDETRTIAEGCIHIHIGQVLTDRNDIGNQLGITAERVRQKRNKIIEEFTKYFTSIRRVGFISKNPYNFIMTHTETQVNQLEGTDFSENFIRWVLSSAFDEVTAIGDIIKPLTSTNDKDYFVHIVPTELCHFYDFNAFVAAIDAKMSEKRTDEERINLKSFMSPFFKAQYYEDKEKDIETSCRSILYLAYPIEVDMGQLIFKPNSRKNNPDIIEDILRATGHPMTLDELYNEFSYQYPERSVMYESFRGNITKNTNIVPIGRTSTYALAEWNSIGNKGGTIRSIAIEYLNSLQEPIARFNDVVEHIIKYRPNTNEISIYDNLRLEQTGAFQFYFLEGERYLGLGGREYPIEYFPLVSESKSVTNMSIKYPKLIAFIKANGRFPFSSNVSNEEIALYKFWAQQEKSFNNGTLEPHGQLFFARIVTKYGHLKLEKKEFDWKQTFKRIVEIINKSGIEVLSQTDIAWIEQNLHNYRYFKNSMPTWKTDLIEKHLL